MGRLVYTSIGSLDGFVADEAGEFDWSAPDPEVHAYLNDRERAITLELYGRRLYEVMKVWETYGTSPDSHDAERAYGEIWRGRDKVVFSTTLSAVDTSRTRLERTFDAVSVRHMIDAAPGDVGIGGPDLAAQALRAGLVDRLEYYANPVVIGGGTSWLPSGVRVRLRLAEHHVFGSGVVLSAYDVDR